MHLAAALLAVLLTLCGPVWQLSEQEAALAAVLGAGPQYEYACTWPCQSLHWLQAAEVVVVVASVVVMTYLFDEPEPRTWHRSKLKIGAGRKKERNCRTSRPNLERTV
eukprot:SAG22_NODE_910_length_6547_cov_2.044975_11_plen_108_part_00